MMYYEYLFLTVGGSYLVRGDMLVGATVDDKRVYRVYRGGISPDSLVFQCDQDCIEKIYRDDDLVFEQNFFN